MARARVTGTRRDEVTATVNGVDVAASADEVGRVRPGAAAEVRAVADLRARGGRGRGAGHAAAGSETMMWRIEHGDCPRRHARDVRCVPWTPSCPIRHYGLAFMGKQLGPRRPRRPDSGPGPPSRRRARTCSRSAGRARSTASPVAIGDAGWEVRDCPLVAVRVGFPKSLDVSKAIDKVQDDRDGILRVTAFVPKACRDPLGHERRDCDPCSARTGWPDTGPRCVTAVRSDARPVGAPGALLGLGDGWTEVARLNARKGRAWRAWKGLR